MAEHRTLVTWSALPVALVGVGALTIAASGAMSGFGAPMPWLIVGLAILGIAIGVVRGLRWASFGEAVVAVILILGILLIALFSLAMVASTGGGLDGNMFGTPFGVLNGWASLLLYAVAFAAALWMLLASVFGRRTPEVTDGGG